MTREEAIWWVNHLFEIRKEEYFNKGMVEDAKEVQEAQHMAIEALQIEITRCKNCKHWDTDKNCGYCDTWNHYISNEDFYCGCGEERGNK